MSSQWHAQALTCRETFEVAAFAKDYIGTNGAADPVFRLYFGDRREAYPAALGAYDALLSSNKDGVLFRCDNPDGVRTPCCGR